MSRVAFCRQCYLPGSACRCLESSSIASTASTTGPLWSDIADPTFGTNPAPAGRGAGLALPYGSSSTAGGSIWDLPSTDFPGLPGAPSAIRQPRPPAGRASHLESQLMAIRYGLTAPPDPLRLPQPTWMPPTTQNRRRVQLPPPPPKTDSASTTDQSQQTTALDPGPEGQGTRGNWKGWLMDSNPICHPSPAKKCKMLFFGLCSTCGYRPSNLGNECQLKCA